METADTATADVTAEQSLALGDSFYVDENYGEAVDAYAAALLVERPSAQQTSTVHFRALSRRSAAFFQLGRYDEALEDSLAAQQSLSQGVTGLRTGEGELSHKRAGFAAFHLNRFEEAKRQFSSAAQLAVLSHRDDAVYQKWMNRCETKMNPTPPIPESPSITRVAASGSASATPTEPPIVELSNSTALPSSALAAATGTTATTPVVVSSPPSVVPTTTPAVVSNPPAQTPTQTTSSSQHSALKRPTMPKYQFWQSDTVMTIAILETNVQPQNLRVDIQPQRLTVIMAKGGIDFTVIAGNLFDTVDVSRCRVQIRDEKVLLKLRKERAHEWHELFLKKSVDDDVETTSSKVIPETEVPTVDTTKARPYASNRDWDKIESSLKEQEKKEVPEGDEALNKLFRDIYSKADEDTRRAMVKSFQTSGGTVLSTNWDEVGKKDYEKERTAPKNMEWKTWEGDKLPMEED